MIRFSFTLSCPQGVPSSGGPFLVLHNCGLDLCPHQRCVHGSLRAKDRHKKYLIKSDVLYLLYYVVNTVLIKKENRILPFAKFHATLLV